MVSVAVGPVMSDGLRGVPGTSPVPGGVPHRGGALRPNDSIQSPGSRLESLSSAIQAGGEGHDPSTLWTALEQVLPMGILKEPGLQVAEWGWRRLVVESLVDTFSLRQLPVTGQQTSLADEGATTLLRGSLNLTLQTLWGYLEELAVRAEGPSSSTAFDLTPRPLETSSLTQFSRWSSRDLETAPLQVRTWVLLDRWLAAVPWVPGTITGSGLFQPQDKPIRFEYWRGWRDTRRAEEKLIHRLVLHLHLPQGPCQITLLTARPEVSVFVATESKAVQKWVVEHQENLRGALDKQGWLLHRCVGTPLDQD